MNDSKKIVEMKINYNFFKATYIERPNRFITKVNLNGEILFSHLPDPGRLNELLIPGATLLLKKETNPNRKTQFSTQAILHKNILISLNTLLPNKFISFLIKEKKLHFLNDWDYDKREVPFGNNRFDFQLKKKNKLKIVEVKSVSLVENNIARFPDAVTTRGKKHVLHLMNLASKGFDVMIIFVVQRHDANLFQPKWDRDPQFCKALFEYSKKGLPIHVIKMKMTTNSFQYLGEIPYQLKK